MAIRCYYSNSKDFLLGIEAGIESVNDSSISVHGVNDHEVGFVLTTEDDDLESDESRFYGPDTMPASEDAYTVSHSFRETLASTQDGLLDEFVHEIAQARASRTNNGGISAQVRFLLAEGVSEQEILDVIKGEHSDEIDDLCESLNCATGADIVDVSHWDRHAEANASRTHEIGINDQRLQHGQVFVDIATKDGHVDDMLSFSIEINSNPLDEDDHVPCGHVHFDGDNRACAMYKVGDKILIRPETDVFIEPFQAEINGVSETLYWMDNQ